jgi:hypothetical protein
MPGNIAVAWATTNSYNHEQAEQGLSLAGALTRLFITVVPTGRSGSDQVSAADQASPIR